MEKPVQNKDSMNSSNFAATLFILDVQQAWFVIFGIEISIHVVSSWARAREREGQGQG